MRSVTSIDFVKNYLHRSNFEIWNLNEWLNLHQGKKRRVQPAIKSGPEKCSRKPAQSSPTGPMAPHAAVTRVDALLSLSESEKLSLLHELLCTDEDPILVLKENPAWNGLFPGGSAAVINAIATWNMPAGRRDVNAPGLLFHFNDAYDLDQCKAAIMAAHPNAFSLSPASVAALGGAIHAANVVPMAFTAVVHKVGVREDDVQSFQFFYL